MSMPYSTLSTHAVAKLPAMALLDVTLASCGTYADKGAAQTTGTGAIAGAVGGAVTALVKQDWNVDSTALAETKMREGTTALGNIREEYGRPRVCVV